ncbi:putative membrane protein [Methanomicrobium sp. W14]|uniref:heparan-alpha-glucosaminide N-acetyltransferase n=1 Tax=Methanomicrobium sp. W14 TaxID=2817839 RepID=UPI001AE5FA10|nr:heparan-alpha-glucosaminide N-acetyltransferase [Methanomicrobium sp. W14]MBP2132292.1 putative membrane protein [Methanomicrobium sp. W14]
MPGNIVVKKRFLELDSFRGLAIFMMVWFHLIFDLTYFGIYYVNVSTGFWRYFGYTTAVMFVFIAGVSVYISSERSKKHLFGFKYYIKFFKRGLFLILIGEVITFVTWAVIGEGFIVFGILHLIGFSVFVSPFFMKLKKYNLLAGFLVIIAGFLISGTTGPYFLLPFGITPPGFVSLDYEPVFPWFGVFLIGISAGTYFYPGAKRRFSGFSVSDNIFFKFMSFMGRHSLLIYLIHQPVIVLLLSLSAGRILI